MAKIKVHGLPFSSCTARVLACLNEKQIEYELIPVNVQGGDHKQPQYLSLNPFGLIPALQDGDLTLFESRAIIKYLAKKYNGQGSPNLLGSTVEEEAVVEQWCDVEAHHFNPPCYAIVSQIIINPLKGGTTDEAVVASNEEKLSKVLDVYEEWLSKSKYLAGDWFSLADLQHMPFLHYLMNDVGKATLISSRKHVNAWWEDISSRPAWKKVAVHMKFPSK
jgi:glutathione S-transferase